ncbi:MAG TPA: TonB-dependent receptor [Gemmatimonadales bacterium]|nr:TonB-dependent receptor [Gemmatimonadales bacterium]
MCTRTSVTHDKARLMLLLTSLLARTRAGLCLLAGGLLLAAAPAAAQQGTGTIKGTVTQSANGQPLAGVIVTVSGTTIKAATNTRGAYTIDRAPTGAQTLVFRWLGYRPTEVQANVAASGVTTADAKMEQLPIQLSELQVTGASKVPERSVEAPAAFAIVEPRVLQSVGITAQAPLALREVPGVDITQSGMNDFNVNARGFNSTLNRRVLVLQDGRDLAIAFLGSQEWNALAVPTDEYSKMELVRGPGSALYGANAFFGVLNITTPTAREVAGTKVTLGGGQLSTKRADLRHAGVLGRGRWGYRLNAGYNESDSWSKSRTSADGLDLKREYGPVVDDSVKHPIPLSREARALNGQTAAPGTGAISGEADPVKNMYGSARLDYYANDGSVITGESGIAQVENELFVTGIGRVQVTKATRPYARLGWANKGFNVMAYWNGRRTKEPQYSLASGGTLLENSNILHIEAQDIRSFDDTKGRVVFGSSVRNYRVNTDSTLMRGVDDDRSDYYYSAFGQVEYQLASKVKAVAAARFDIGTLINPQLSPKVAIVVSPNDRHSFRFTINRAFQTPNYSEFYLRAAAAAPANFTALETALRASPLAPVLAGVPVGKLFSFTTPTAATVPTSASVPVFASGNAKLDVETTLGFEVGYRGDLSPSVYFTLDVYANRIRNFVTDLLPGVNPAFPYWTAPTQVPAANRAALVDAVRNALLSSPASVLAGRGLTRTEDGNSAILVSYTNAGKVKQWGLEGGAGWQMTRTLRTDGTLTLFDYSVDQSTVARGDSLLANTPSAKATVSLSYAERRLSASANMRAVRGYAWAAGVFTGFIEPNVSFGADLGYDVNNNFKVFVTGTNVFDSKKFEIYGGSVNGRRILGGVTARF